MRRRRAAPPSKRRGPNESSLVALGRKIEANEQAPRQETGGVATSDAVGGDEIHNADEIPNADGLRTLGREIDRSAPRAKGRRHRRRRARRVIAFTSVGLVVLLVGLAGASYYYGYLKYKAVQKPLCGATHKVCRPELPGKPFNVLAIGSDSRAGLTGRLAKVTGASGNSVSGQRSDVVKIFHVDPNAGTISVLSIPRDTVVSMIGNTNLYGNYNRINVNYQSGPPTLLVRTIEADFGIPINHVIQVSFAGLAASVQSLGGIYMSFPFRSLDRYSSLDIRHTGCQLLNGFEGLAVARSRHFYYLQNGQWNYDGTSDFGRIDRQNQFLRALIDRAKSKATDLLAISSFLSAIPQGIAIDDTFGYNELLGLALKFHSFNPSTMAAYTLPTYSAVSSSLGDVLFVQQPTAQQILVKIFGQVGSLGGLMRPTSPPPNSSFVPTPPPAVATPTTTSHPASHHVTTSTQPLHTEPWYTFNPVACTPGTKVAGR